MDSEIIKYIISTFIGGLISLLSSIYVTKQTTKSQFDLFEKEEKMQSEATQNAILSEFRALKSLIELELTPKMTEQSLSFDYNYGNISDYFAIFHANLVNIGKIEDTQLRETLVEIYVNTKYLLDCIRTNNNVSDQYEAIIFKQQYIKPTYDKVMDLLKVIELYN